MKIKKYLVALLSMIFLTDIVQAQVSTNVTVQSGGTFSELTADVGRRKGDMRPVRVEGLFMYKMVTSEGEEAYCLEVYNGHTPSGRFSNAYELDESNKFVQIYKSGGSWQAKQIAMWLAGGNYSTPTKGEFHTWQSFLAFLQGRGDYIYYNYPSWGDEGRALRVANPIDYSKSISPSYLSEALDIYENATKTSSTTSATKLASTKLNWGSPLITKISEGVYQVTYNPTSASKMDLTFSVSGGTITNNVWTGTSGTLTFTVNVEKCQTAEFTVKASKQGTGKEMYVRLGGGGSQSVITKIKDGNADYSTNGTVADACDCADYDPNSPDYPEACKDQKIRCYTEIDWPDVCQEYDEEHMGYIHAPGEKSSKYKNILACIVDNVDDVGNAYTISGVEGLDGNPYCTVSCKEDYEIGLPGAVRVNSGRYFTLKTRIAGTRDCYTNDIKVEEYINNVIEYQEAMVKALNEKNKEEALEKSKARALNNKKTSEYKECDCSSKNATEIPDCQTKTSEYYVDPQGGEDYDCYEIYYYETDATYGLQGSLRNGETLVRKQSSKCHVEYKSGTKKSGGGYDESDGWGTDEHGKPIRVPVTYTCKNPSSETYTPPTIGDTNYQQYITMLNEAADFIKACITWENDYCMDPTITFKYEEPYHGGTWQFVGDGSTEGTPSLEEYCQRLTAWTDIGKEVTEEYVCQTVKGGQDLETFDYIICDDDGCYNYRNQKELSIHNRYIHKQSVNERHYTSPIQFFNAYPYGTISEGGGHTALPAESIPVQLNSGEAAYTFNFNYQGVGMYNDGGTCDLGRLISTGTSSKPSVFDYWVKTGEYFCAYVVNCDECDFSCSGSGCNITDPDPGPKCDECNVACSNCVIAGDNGEIAVHVTNISTNDVVPEGKDMGNNWTDSKGQATIEEIEKNGDNILVKAEYSARMSIANIARVQEYNKRMATFNDNSLSCSTGSDGYTICRSNFLSEGEKEGYFSNFVRNEEWKAYNGTAWK